ncbi:MAG: EAL domain-containing protein [Pseudomonadota bacterium]
MTAVTPSQPGRTHRLQAQAQALAYGLIALLAAALAIAAWSVRIGQPLLYNIEGLVIDAQTRLRGVIAPAATPAIVIVTVDDRSLLEFGSLPVDRRILAQGVDRLHAAGARWIAFDMLFPEASRRDANADAILAESLRRVGNVLLPYALQNGRSPYVVDAAAGGTANTILPSAYMRYRNEDLRTLMPFQPSWALAPIPTLASAARGMGHVSVQRGSDGAVRYDQPALWLDDELYPSMAMTLAALASGVNWTQVEARLGEGIALGGRNVPLDLVSRQWVNFYGPQGSFPSYSFADLVNGRIPAEALRGRIVLLGGGAVGDSDKHASPFDPNLPGVERLATVIDNLLTGRWLARPYWAASLELALMLALPLFAVGLIARRRPLVSISILAISTLCLLGMAQLLFARERLFISIAFPLAALLMAAALATIWRARQDELSRRRAEARLRASEQRYALAAQGANDGLWDWDIVANRVFYSARWYQLMGLPDHPVHENIATWQLPLTQLERARFQQEIDAHLRGETRQFYHEFQTVQEGELHWFLARGEAVREGGRPVRMAGSLTDISEQKYQEREMAFNAIHDHLTGLHNREVFFDFLQQQLASTRQADAVLPCGVLLIDVDGFRAINERFDHLAGNDLLIQIAQRLRTLEPEASMLARLGDDQFALQFSGAFDAQGQQVLALFKQPFIISKEHETLQQYVSATIAVAHTSQGFDSAEALMNAVGLALVIAKKSQRSQVKLFDPAEQEIQTSRRQLHRDIDLALAADDQFQLYYQPLIRLSDRRLIGFEALIRWHHPARDLVLPDTFIPYAEESGQIIGIGSWTLRTAARQLVAWDRMGFTGDIAVNLSGRQFAEADLEAEAREVLDILSPLSPQPKERAKRIKLEVTESMAMANPLRTAEILMRLYEMGFKISIDDFGTGYSSLSYLHRFPFHTLKIDRSFVIRLGSGREAQEIVRTIVSLGRVLGKQILAEGVEDETQAVKLFELGVEVGQGWLFDKGLPEQAATQLVQSTLRRG